MAIFLQLFVNGILTSLLYALIAVGVSFLYATSKIFHLAHGVVVMAAGYLFWWSVTALHVPFLLAVAIAATVACGVGLAMNEWVYERLRRRGAKGLGYLIATLALLMLGGGLIQLFFGASPKTFTYAPRILTFFGVNVTVTQLSLAGISLALIALFVWISRGTRIGKAMRATADNEEVAELLGINTRAVRRVAFALASLLAAAAGIFIGLEFNLDPQMGVLFAIKGFAGAVIGGVGSVGGAVLGSFLIGFSEQGAVWFWGSGFRNAITFGFLFVVLLFRPQGMFGLKRKE